MINATVHTAAIAGLETALNRALELDSGALESLASLNGKVFQLNCTSPELELYLLPLARGVRLVGLWEGEITTAIKGSASDFAELASSPDPAAALINGNLELHGDSAPLLALQNIFNKVNIDWEAPLVDALGDVAGHQIAEGLRGLFGWSKVAASSIRRQVEEFITEEARLTPPRQEVEDFYKDVYELSLRVERIQAKIRKLSKNVDILTGATS